MIPNIFRKQLCNPKIFPILAEKLISRPRNEGLQITWSNLAYKQKRWQLRYANMTTYIEKLLNGSEVKEKQ